MSECSRALVKDVKSVSFDSAETYAMSRFIDEDLEKDEKSSLGITVPIYGVPVSFTSERAKKLFSHFFSQTGISWTRQQSLRLMSQTLSPEAVEAYRICIEGQHKSGPRAIAHSATHKEVVISISWFSAPNAPTQSQATYQYTHGTPVKELPTQWVTGERKSFIFQREASEDFTFIVTIGGIADEVVVPWLPRITVSTEKVLMVDPPNGTYHRVANDGSGRSDSKAGVIHAPQGTEIDTNGVAIAVHARVGNIDADTKAKITDMDTSRILWSALCKPLAAEGGGDLQFQIKYPLIKYNFQILPD